MSDAPSVAELAGLAHQFTRRAFGAFPSQESADLGNALFAANKDSLEAIQSELEPFAAEQKEQIAILEANQPAEPGVTLEEAAGAFGLNPAQLDEPTIAKLKQLAPMVLGAEISDEPFVPDSDEVAAAKAEAVAAAEAKLEEIASRAAPVDLKLQEAVADLLNQALGADIFNNIVPAGHPLRGGEISEGFKANNAPTLAAAFAPS